jgi:hypothetical protein
VHPKADNSGKKLADLKELGLRAHSQEHEDGLEGTAERVQYGVGISSSSTKQQDL